MRPFGSCVQNILHNNVVVDGGERQFGITRRDTGVEKGLEGTMDDSGVLVLIQALGDAKIPNKWAMNTHLNSLFAPDIK